MFAAPVDRDFNQMSVDRQNGRFNDFAMGKTMALELAPLRVNIISPGLVDTPAYDWMNAEQKAGFFKQMGGQLPVGRVGKSEEIAQAIELALSNGFITGAVIDIDGGGSL